MSPEIHHSRRHYSIQRRWQDILLEICIWRVHSKEVDRRISWEKLNKAYQRGVINKLLKKLRDRGTVDRRPGSGRPRSDRTEENIETVNDLVLSQDDKSLQIQTFYQNLVLIGWLLTNTAVRGDYKCNLFAFSWFAFLKIQIFCRYSADMEENANKLHFLPYLLNICRKFEFSISQGSVATCLRCEG